MKKRTLKKGKKSTKWSPMAPAKMLSRPRKNSVLLPRSERRRRKTTNLWTPRSPSRRARRAYRAANAVPSPFFTATAAAAVAAAAAFPLPRPISRARLSSIPSGNHTPQYYASRAQRTALGKNALPIVPESQAATPFSGGTPVASHFEAYKNRRDAVTSYGRARVIGEASKPAAERSHVPSLDASPASADNGSEMEGDEDAGGSRGNARRLLNKPPIVDLTGDDVDSPSQHLESLYNGGQIAPALPNLSSIGYGYQQLHNMGSNAEYTAYNMLYSNHGPLYANASNVVGLDDFENTQNAHRIGNSYRQAGSDAAFARSTGSRFRRNVNPGTRDFSKPKSDASSGYLQSSTSFREGPVSPRLGGSQGVTNLPNLNRPPGPGFAGGYYSQAMQQRETRVPGACRLQGYEAGPSESVRAMPPPPVPPRVGRPSSRVEAPTCFGPQAEPNALFPEILSQEWLQQQYSEEASGKLLLQFLNEPEYAPFPFDDAPYQAEPATHMRLPHSSPETQGSQAHINPPVSLAAALVQQQQEATISPSVLHTAATLPMAGSDDMQNTGGVLWSFNFQKPPSPGKEENLAMPDAVFGWGTIAPQESLLRPPSQGQLHSGQLIQESENREIGLPKEPFYDVNMHQIDDLFGEGHPWNEISTHFLPSSPGIIGHNPFPTEGGISDAPGEHSLALSADDSLLSYQAGPYGIEYPYAALSSPPHVEPSGEQFSENLSPEQQTVMKLEDPGTS